MIALKAIHTSFTPTTHPLSQIRTRSTFHKTSLLCLSKPNDSDSGSGSDSDSSSSETKGDTQKQDLLARIAMLQTQKVRLTDYIDERSDFLTQFAEEATVEFDKIGEDALKDLDEASARVCSFPYLALMAVLAAVIAESFISSSADWRKVAVLGGILVGLITQFSYEQRLILARNYDPQDSISALSDII